MVFETLKIKNFLSVGEAELNLANQGLVLIEGRNLDDPSAKSNGAGKSSIVDALCWVLYGKTARGVGADDVINRQAKKNCSVELTVIDGDMNYLITRCRKDKEGGSGLYIVSNKQGDDKMRDLTKGTTAETQALIDNIIGCTHEVFVASVYAGQDAMPDLPAMTDKQLKELLESVIGVEKLTLAYKLTQQKSLEATSAYKIASANADNAQAELNRIKTQQDYWQLQLESWKGEQYARIEALKATVQHEKALVEQISNDQIKITPLFLKAQNEEKLINDQIANIEGLKQVVANCEREVQNALRQYMSEMTKFNYMKEACAKRAKEIELIDKKVGTKCSECGKTYEPADLEGAKAALMESLRADVQSATQQKAVADGFGKKHAEAQEKLEQAKASVPDQSELMRKMKAVNDIKNQYRQISYEYQKCKDDMARAENELKTVTESTPEHINNALDKLGGDELNQVELVREQAQKAEQAKEHCDTIADVLKIFGPQGVRQHVLDAVTPILNDRTARYLDVLSDGKLQAVWTTLTQTKKGEVREKFNIEVTNSVGGNSFESLSGGEKRKVRVACCLALQELVSSRATKPIEIFIADEVDHALDEAGVERLIGVLNEKATVCKSLFVISHNPLRNWIDNTITVEKENGKTRITQS